MKKSKWDQNAYNMIYNLLLCGVLENHDSIVLGAWGCGAFGNDPIEVAKMFKTVIKKYFKNSFQKIYFAIIEDKYSAGINFKTFNKILSE